LVVKKQENSVSITHRGLSINKPGSILRKKTVIYGGKKRDRSKGDNMSPSTSFRGHKKNKRQLTISSKLYSSVVYKTPHKKIIRSLGFKDKDLIRLVVHPRHKRRVYLSYIKKFNGHSAYYYQKQFAVASNLLKKRHNHYDSIKKKLRRKRPLITFLKTKRKIRTSNMPVR